MSASLEERMMRKMHMSKKLISIALAAILTLLAAGYAAAAPSGYFEWPLKSTADVYKTWTVTFNMPLDPSSVNSESVYVVDANENRVSTKLALSADKRAVQVSPTGKYSYGMRYEIRITGKVKGSNGKYMLQPVALPFIVTPSAGNAILDVKCYYSSFLTSVTVTVAPTVFRVTVNGQDAHYIGGDTYSIGLTGLKQGASVTIRAYDQNDKLLESRQCTIN